MTVSLHSASESNVINKSIDNAEARNTDNQLDRLSANDRLQLDICVDNMIAGKAVITVNIRNHSFLCDYARTEAPRIRSRESYGFFYRDSLFNGRISYRDKKGDHHNRTIRIHFDAKGYIRQASLFTMFPIPKKETKLAFDFPKSVIPRSDWYTDRISGGRCVHKNDSWQQTANLIAATLALRLSQSFKFALLAKGAAKSERAAMDAQSDPKIPNVKAIPVLWGVRLNGESIVSRKHLPSLTHEQCQSFCLSNRCLGWSYRSAEITSSGRPITASCTLFDSVESLTAENKFVSALKPAAFTELKKSSSWIGNLCGDIFRDTNGKIVRNHYSCKSRGRPFLSSTPNRKSCSPLQNTCRSYDPPHPIEVVGGDC